MQQYAFLRVIGAFSRDNDGGVSADGVKVASLREQMLKTEVAKWKEFGHLLAESYDKLKKKHVKQVEAEKKGRLITEALKDQVNKLKALLNHCTAENKDLKRMLESFQTDFHSPELERRFSELKSENDLLRREKENLSRLVAALTQEKDILENEKVLNNKLVQQLNDKIKVPLRAPLETQNRTR